MKILVVDDDAAGLEIRRLILKRHGFEVSAAADAATARQIFAAERPDVVVLDLRIPELADGLALIRDFQASPILVLSGNRADIEGRDEHRMVRAVLQKPVRSDELVRAIRNQGQ